MGFIRKIFDFFSHDHEDDNSGKKSELEKVRNDEAAFGYEQMFRNQPDFVNYRSNDGYVFTLGRYLYEMIGIRQEQLRSMCIVSAADGYAPKNWLDNENIWNFNLISALDYNGQFDRLKNNFDERSVSMVIGYSSPDPSRGFLTTFSTVFVYLQGVAITNGTKFVRLSMLCPPCTRGLNIPHNVAKNKMWNVTFAIDSKDQTEWIKEFEKVKADLKEKMDNRTLTKDNVSLAQLYIYRQLTSDVAFRFFVADQLYKSGCYAQAMSAFTDLFERFVTTRYQVRIRRSELELMVSVIYKLGVCCMKLKLYVLALHYLLMLDPETPFLKNYEIERGFITCMAHLDDLRTAPTIDVQLKRILKKKKEGTYDGTDADFELFLEQTKAKYLFRLKRYDEAEPIFKKLLNVPSCSDWALDSLTKIQQEREKKQNNTK